MASIYERIAQGLQEEIELNQGHKVAVSTHLPKTVNACPEGQLEAFLVEAVEAWEEYELTGLHITSDEANVWLDQLVQGLDVEPPECHV